MREFFQEWRRKVGCVTLVLACALMGMWMRSQAVEDWLVHCTDDGILGLFSRPCGISWTRHSQWPPEELFAPPGSWQTLSYVAKPPYRNRFDNYIMHDRWQALGFDFCNCQEPYSTNRVADWTIPYWSLVLPLTLLSLYLFLWKPRKRAE